MNRLMTMIHTQSPPRASECTEPPWPHERDRWASSKHGVILLCPEVTSAEPPHKRTNPFFGVTSVRADTATARRAWHMFFVAIRTHAPLYREDSFFLQGGFGLHVDYKEI